MKGTGFFCSLGAFAAIGGAGYGVLPLRETTNPPVRQTGLQAHDDSAGASLLGQFRTNISSWLWVRTDLYLHNGVMMRPITEGELKSGVQAQKAADDGHERLHDDVSVTVVPPKERDFRGWFGDIDRAVSAYKDMHGHSHNDPKDSLPLFRLMTWIDPHFIEGWTTGAMVFARERNEAGTRKALDFLEEGRRQNPQSIDILTSIAYMKITRQRDIAGAVPLLATAIDSAREMGNRLSPGEKSGLENAYRWLALCLRDLGQRDKQIIVLQEGLRLFPDDVVLQNLLKRANDPKSKSAAEEAEKIMRTHEHDHDHHHDHDHDHHHDHGHGHDHHH